MTVSTKMISILLPEGVDEAQMRLIDQQGNQIPFNVVATDPTATSTWRPSGPMVLPVLQSSSNQGDYDATREFVSYILSHDPAHYDPPDTIAAFTRNVLDLSDEHRRQGLITISEFSRNTQGLADDSPDLAILKLSQLQGGALDLQLSSQFATARHNGIAILFGDGDGR